MSSAFFHNKLPFTWPVPTRQSPVSSGIPWASHRAESDIDRERKYTHPLVGGPTKSYAKGINTKSRMISTVSHERKHDWSLWAI